ncbi:hypothetical protein [Neobacillus kokaensis]|uniref:Uncharacterized protein n=1 Tax=Neobacillus kokaensis TaxID=2759023 RepID=A0ABQ3N4B6_9BACI|nr:hypothetical protein [Neobacillus kokaensis]GHH98367.1 hypothetical protein AM1BK_19100 [Neobacillus kokaensis]
MSIKNFFILFRKNEQEKELRKKLSILELNIKELKTALHALQNQTQPEKTHKTNEPPIIIEKINIEKIILDKYELNNNFGQLGIKELKGKLNIGATYGGEFAPKLEEEESEPKVEKEKMNDESEDEKERGPKINIKAKKDNKKD